MTEERVRVVIDLGFLADLDEACSAFRAVEAGMRTYPRLSKSLRRLDRLRRYYNKKLKAAAKRGIT